MSFLCGTLSDFHFLVHGANQIQGATCLFQTVFPIFYLFQLFFEYCTCYAELRGGNTNNSSLRKCHHDIHLHFVTFAVLLLNCLAFHETLPRLIVLSLTVVFPY